MNRILFVILAVILILSIFAIGCETNWSDIKDVVMGGSGMGWVVEPAVITVLSIDIWADESLSPQYFLSFRSREANTCVEFDHYIVTRYGSTIRVEAFNREIIGVACRGKNSYTEHTLPLGSDFVSGRHYRVIFRSWTETFVAQ